MGKTGKIVGGVLSAWPILYFGFFTQMLLPSFFQQGTDTPHLWTFVAIHFATALLCMVLFVYYLVKAARNKELGDQKTGWILGLIFLSALVWPIYWYQYIWKKNV